MLPLLSQTKVLPVLSRVWRRERQGLLSRRFHGEWNENAQKVPVNYLLKDGSQRTVDVPVGTTVLDAAHHYDIDLEGACEASLACSTCHVILDRESYDKLPPASDREDDLLNMAPCLEETSRLGCQVKCLPHMGVKLPRTTLNFYVDGFVPKPH
ncbi:MAG: hypothetical protein KVP17_003928 [Porospora cf. gigantea B]|uniref:uncharacterized protein n=1 Tax=Porospora cf. gigantea B TaxID=2853592 RepID=UPI0035719571|nr:MAG: hypothetical protein KVP17_003928 [Porospora cf. gigantea B]